MWEKVVDMNGKRGFVFIFSRTGRAAGNEVTRSLDETDTRTDRDRHHRDACVGGRGESGDCPRKE